MGDISANYQQLRSDEIADIATRHGNAWQHPDIPNRQWAMCVAPELEQWTAGKDVAPYSAFIRCLDKLPLSDWKDTSILDVGASSGYYREVMRRAGFDYTYTACDFSPAYERLAHEVWPDMDFHIAPATQLPFADGSFDIVLSGGMLMTMPQEWEKAVAEMVRVSRRYVVLHRTPVLTDKLTAVFVKEAYGVPTIECHFNETEFKYKLLMAGLIIRHAEDVFFSDGFGHRTYVCEHFSVMHHPV